MIHRKATWTGDGGVSRISSAGARNSRSLRFIPGVLTQVLPEVLSSASARATDVSAAGGAGSAGGTRADRVHAAISAGWL